MGLSKGLKKISPAHQLHAGINRAVGIDEDFASPLNNPLEQRIEANRSGDSQWQKINPTNIRDANEKAGYDYAGGGRDPKPTPAPTAAPPGGTQGGGLRGMLQRAQGGGRSGQGSMASMIQQLRARPGTGGGVKPQAPPNMRGMPPQMGPPGGGGPRNPMGGMQRQFQQAQALRGPPSGMRAPNPTGMRMGRR